MLTIGHKNISNELFQIRYKLLYILFGSVTLVFFLNFFTPFDLKSSFNVSFGKFHLILSGYALPFIAVSCFSQFILKPLIQKRSSNLTYLIFIVIVEFILLDIGFALWYARYNVVYERSLASILLTVIPETLIFLTFINISLIVFLQNLNKSAVPVESEILEDKETVQSVEFTDDKNRRVLSIGVQSLLYIKSADNYVDVWFMEKGKMKSRLIRSTIKRLERKNEGNNIVRCHRSYMVNLLAVKGCSQASGKLKIYLDDRKNIVIPVSVKYASSVLEFLKPHPV